MPRLAAVTGAEVPGVGEMRVTNPRDWWRLILGVLMFGMALVLAQGLAGWLRARVPGLPGLAAVPGAAPTAPQLNILR